MDEQGIRHPLVHGFISVAVILSSVVCLLLSLYRPLREFCTDGLDNEGGGVSGHYVGIWTYRCVYTAPFNPPHMRFAVRDHSNVFWVYWDGFWLTGMLVAGASLIVVLVLVVRGRWRAAHHRPLSQYC
jgi:hypothetical protein